MIPAVFFFCLFTTSFFKIIYCSKTKDLDKLSSREYISFNMPKKAAEKMIHKGRTENG